MRILIIDDEPAQVNILRDILADCGYEILTAENGISGIDKFKSGKPEIVLTDFKMPGLTGNDVLKEVKNIQPDTQVIIMTAFGSIPGAVDAIKNGAYDYLTKPFQKDDLIRVIKRAEDKFNLLNENRRLKDEIKNRYKYDQIIGNSIAMQNIYTLIDKVKDIDTTVLICGESGTGKELVAKAIHYNGKRKDKPYVVINCGAIPETLIESELFGHEKGAFTGATHTHTGKFELANSGTIFLDEIGTMRTDLQIRLLRVLQEKQVERLGSGKPISIDVRVIAATNEDLEQKITAGSFRADLFHRLNVFAIHLPPLRERKEDISLLTRNFIEKFANLYNKTIPKLTPQTMQRIEQYDFPGNVRELENIIEKTLVINDEEVLSPEKIMLPINTSSNFEKTPNKNASLTDIEYNMIVEALKRSRGSIKDASKRLGISYKTLQYRMKKYKINKEIFR